MAASWAVVLSLRHIFIPQSTQQARIARAGCKQDCEGKYLLIFIWLTNIFEKPHVNSLTINRISCSNWTDAVRSKLHSSVWNCRRRLHFRSVKIEVYIQHSDTAYSSTKRKTSCGRERGTTWVLTGPNNHRHMMLSIMLPKSFNIVQPTC